MAVIFIHDFFVISPQNTANDDFFKSSTNYVNSNKLTAIEPNYSEVIPNNILRRMGKGVRMGVGAGLFLTQKNKVDGIIVGTANGGLEDCIKFLNQIISYQEGTLTPTNFVQSTPNAIASTLSISSTNYGYNVTHVNAGLALECALLDAMLLLHEDIQYKKLLVGSIEELSEYNFNIDLQKKWIRTEKYITKNILNEKSTGSIVGEGSTMMILSNSKVDSLAEITDLCMINTFDFNEFSCLLKSFMLQNGVEFENIDSIIFGYNGDNKIDSFLEKIKNTFFNNQNIFAFKHLFGESPTSIGFGIWLSANILNGNIKNETLIINKNRKSKMILIINAYFTHQTSIILMKN